MVLTANGNTNDVFENLISLDAAVGRVGTERLKLIPVGSETLDERKFDLKKSQRRNLIRIFKFRMELLKNP